MTGTAAPPQAPTGEPTIALHECSKWYGDVIGINQVSVEIRPGITGLLGPNGAGKSTLMKCICGQLKPNRGSVRLIGRDPFRDPETFRRVGYCPDSETLYDGLTAHQFVTMMGKLAGYTPKEARARASERLALVDLSDAMHRVIQGYSKGMRQRTKLAAALVHDPDILLLDEPLNGLDPAGRLHMLNVFRKLAQQGCTVVVSSHILHEIEALTDSIVLVHRGRMLAEGNIHDIRELMDDQPLTLQIEGTNLRVLGARLAALPNIESLQYARKHIVVRTHHPDDIFQIVQEGALGDDFTISGVHALDDNLDSIFQYLVKA